VSYFTIIALVVAIWILSPLLTFIIIGFLVYKKTGQKTILNKILTKDGIIIVLYGGFGLFSIISIYLKWLTSYRSKCSWWRLKEFGGKV
jgi:hypothetical protein